MRYFILILSIVSSLNLFAQKNKKDSEFDLEKYFNRDISTTDRRKAYDNIYNYSQAIKQNPNDAANYLNRGVNYASLGLYPDAILDYNRALKHDSTMSYAYYNRGVARARYRYTKASCKDVKKAALLGLSQAKETYKKECGFFIPQLGKLP